MEYKQAELARIYVMPESTISRALKRGDLVKNSGGRIDDENPRNSAYLSPRRLKANREAIEKSEGNALAARAEVKNIEVKNMDLESRLAIYQQMQRMTIREAIIAYGSAEAMRDFVGLLRDMAAADEKDQKVRERRLQLVEKDFVTSHIFQYLDTLNNQLLDWPDSFADSIVSFVQAAGAGARSEVIRVIKDGTTKIIRGAKEHIANEMRSLQVKHNERDDGISDRLEAIENKIGD
jgi:hypothetical protein